MAVQKHPAMLASLFMASVTVCAPGFGQYRAPYHPANAYAQNQPAVSQQPRVNTSEASSSLPENPGTTSLGLSLAASTAPSLLDHPPQPAKVALKEGKLTINAHNSTLAQILDQISRNGGMKVSGLRAGNPDQRVFGIYGPGTPREVLSELLNGSGYNVLMLGTTPSGAPRELSLSVRPVGGVPNPPPETAAQMRQEYEENRIRPTHYAPEPQRRPEPSREGLGSQQGIRTPQQILQELEQMRQQHQEENQQPN